MTDREREKNCVSQNIAETMQPVTEPMPKEKRAEVSDGKPVAWAVMDGHEFMEFCTEEEEAKGAAKYYGGHIVPLYRHPQPTLTGAEREAVEHFAREFRGPNAATLRGLLERLK